MEQFTLTLTQDILERAMNFAPEAPWDTKQARLERVLQFMEQRHYLSLARKFEEVALAEKITTANHFFIRITNMELRCAAVARCSLHTSPFITFSPSACGV